MQTLHTQLDGVNQQLAALKSSQSVDQNMGALMAQNKELTDKLATAQTEIKTLTSNPKSAASKLAAQLKLVREKTRCLGGRERGVDRDDDHPCSNS